MKKSPEEIRPLILHELSVLDPEEGSFEAYQLVASNGTPAPFVLSARDLPLPGVVTYVTAGLSDTPLPGYEDFLRIEVLLLATDSIPFARPLLSSLERSLLAGEALEPGTILFDFVSTFDHTLPTPHLLLTHPLLWSEGFHSFPFAEHTVTWLMGIALTSKEVDFAAEHGLDALLDLIHDAGLTVADWDRPSLV